MQTSTRGRVLEAIWVFILSCGLVGLYANLRWTGLGLVIIELGAIVLLASPKFKVRAVDWSILSIVAFEVPSIVFSQYRANSIRAALEIAIFVLSYLTVRLTIQTKAQITYLSGLLGLGGVWLAISTLNQFTKNAEVLGSVGLTNLVAFRSWLISPPIPWIPGEWFTLLLLALPFACIPSVCLWFKNRKCLAAISGLVPALIVVVLPLSLSRAVFWSTILFFMGFNTFLAWSRLLSLWRAAALLLSLFTILALILTAENIFSPGVFGAYTGRHTSQVRSTEGRISIWIRSLEVVRAHPLLGVGASNSALALTSSADQDETIGFASRTFSLPLQVLVEKGFLGFLLYAIFLALVAREFFFSLRRSVPSDGALGTKYLKLGTPGQTTRVSALVAGDAAHKAISCCFAAGLLAVLVRELVYSSLMEHTLTLALTAVLCGCVVHADRV